MAQHVAFVKAAIAAAAFLKAHPLRPCPAPPHWLHDFFVAGK
jgi:hypothetical protein